MQCMRPNPRCHRRPFPGIALVLLAIPSLAAALETAAADAATHRAAAATQRVANGVGDASERPSANAAASDLDRVASSRYRRLTEGGERWPQRLRFPHGTDAHTGEALAEIDQLVVALRRALDAGRELWVIGVAGRRDAPEGDALALSHDRVDRVASALARRGIKASRRHGFGAPAAAGAHLDDAPAAGHVEFWLR